MTHAEELRRIASGDITCSDYRRAACESAAAEIERLRKVIRRHWNFAAFVHLWVNRNNVTDAERVSVIKNHPSLKEWIGDDNQQQVGSDK